MSGSSLESTPVKKHRVMETQGNMTKYVCLRSLFQTLLSDWPRRAYLIIICKFMYQDECINAKLDLGEGPREAFSVCPRLLSLIQSAPSPLTMEAGSVTVMCI